MYADIIVDISHEKLDRPFQYHVPKYLEEILEVGMCVTIPFGQGNRVIKGYVVDISDQCKFEPRKIKDIAGIVEEDVSVEDKMISLAVWMRRNYGSTMIQALKTVLPVKKTVKSLEHKSIVRLINREETIALIGECEKKHQVAKVRLLKALLDNERIPKSWVTGKLGVANGTIRSLVEVGAIRQESEKIYRNPVKVLEDKGTANHLSSAQRKIVERVTEDLAKGKHETYLIHGITGSGKTEVYIRLIEEVLTRGQQAIVLIPEIALTYQTLLRFYRHFGDRVSVMNSMLSAGEKFDQCERAKRGEIDVMIGPRSALFTPFPHLGMIVIDEEHESSYKSEVSPKYHARETAIEVARMHGASVVLGSATPSLESYYRAKKGEYQLFTLEERLTGGELPKVHIIDLREELKQGNRSIFSRKLQELLRDRIERGEQSMLFLNRRGYAGFISCRSCGYVIKCPHCDVSLSEHRNGQMVCHYCGYSERKVKVCPECGSKYIAGFKAGTEQIEEKIKELFPMARTLRMDGDTTKTKDGYEKILTGFGNGEADILIGTQMIVKGHDFPNVTLVGVIAADLSLGVGDYRAGERTFQLLTQAVGRAGRGTLPGEAVIQTYQPEHYAVVRSAAQDYENFYEEEIRYREMMQYPPVEHLLAVQIFSKIEKDGMEFAQRLANEVKQLDVMVLGPTSANIGKINDIFRFVFYVKQEKYDKLVQIKDYLEGKLDLWQSDKEIVQFDFDPINMM